MWVGRVGWFTGLIVKWLGRVCMFSTEKLQMSISRNFFYSLPFFLEKGIIFLPRNQKAWMQHPDKRILWFFYVVSTSSVNYLVLRPSMVSDILKSLIFLVQFHQWVNLLSYFRIEEKLLHGCGGNPRLMFIQNFSYLLPPVQWFLSLPTPEPFQSPKVKVCVWLALASSRSYSSAFCTLWITVPLHFTFQQAIDLTHIFPHHFPCRFLFFANISVEFERK